MWSYDFVAARTREVRNLRLLTLIDEVTRECLAIRLARRHFNFWNLKLWLGRWPVKQLITVLSSPKRMIEAKISSFMT